jgi:dihydrodipicolinate reductase
MTLNIGIAGCTGRMGRTLIEGVLAADDLVFMQDANRLLAVDRVTGAQRWLRVRTANPVPATARALAATLGITFPFNLLFGLPIYVALAEFFAGALGAG